MFRTPAKQSMTKRIIPVLLLLVMSFLLCPKLAMSASATNKVDTQIADIVIYVDESAKAGVEAGSEFGVEIYIENIATKDGVIGDDLPLTYDRDRLEMVGLEPVFPKAWGIYGAFFGIELKNYDPWSDHYPYYLRSLPDGTEDDEMFTDPVYRITESKAIGYKLRFKALKAGEAFVAVENDFANNKPIMLVVIESSKAEDNTVEVEVVNYGGRGMTVKIDVVEKSAPLPPPVSAVTSEDASSGDISSEDASSGDVSSEDASSGDISSEDASSGDISSEDASSGDISSEDSSSGEPSAAEASEESAAVSEVSKAESADESDGEDADESDGEDGDKGGRKKKGIRLWVIVVIVVTAVAAGAAVGIVLWYKSKEA